MDFVNCNPYGAIQSLHVVLCVVYHLMKSFYFFFISFSCLHDIPHFKQLISQMDQNSVLSSKSSWAETFGLCGGWGGRDTQPQCGLECESSPQTSGKGTRTWLGQHVSTRAHPGLQEAMLGRTTGSLTLHREQQDI